ncbi:ParB/RepB/Spo0J family partition protein [Rhodococcus sp. 27YEA6]|uniref:ParB/RepB/Spo0J family partition protein n=1 Tax=Rhodococcus sp. 27YEA6 TaxID=3156273 RepID=UPI003838D962
MTAIHTGPRVVDVEGEFFVRLDPNALDIGANVRDLVDLSGTPDFVESISEHGVLEAISAVQLADGQIVVRDGQRRTLAAREAGITSIPVIVRTDTTSGETERNIERITAQMEANDQRLALTPGQRAAGAAELLELGLSVTKVSKKVREDKVWVEHAGKIGKSAAARNAVDGEQLDFEQAAILAEFAGDEDAEQQLLDCNWYEFRAVAEELRAERIERAAFEEAAKPYQVKGFTALAQHPGYGTVLTMGDVRSPDGSAVTIEEVEASAAHWSVVLSQTECVFDKATGEPVDEDEVDWYTRENPSADADEDYRHFNTVRVEMTWSPEYLCNDPEAAGLQLSPVMAAVRAGSGPDELTGGALDSEDEAERQRLAKLAEAKRTDLERAEKDRRERKMVRVLNVKAEAATIVRREFLRKLFAAKTPPKEAAAYVATTLAADMHLLTEHRANAVYKELFGTKDSYVSGYVSDQVAKSSAGRAQVLTLALVLGAQESRLEKDAWRSKPKNSDSYLAFLEEQGHTLTPVEEIVRGGKLPEQVAELDE